jgi:hypothetical protein
MDRKGRGTVEISAAEVATALSRSELSSEEEKMHRMRLGIAVVDLDAPLARAAGGNRAIADELLLLEMSLHRAYRRRAGPARASAAQVPSGTGKTKHKIIRALRRKK